MNYTKSEINFNTKYITNMTTWIDRGMLNIDLNTARIFDYGLRGSIMVHIRMENTENYQRLFAYDFDVCKVLSEISRASILSLWYRTVLKYGNIMENCPIPEVGKGFFQKIYWFDEEFNFSRATTMWVIYVRMPIACQCSSDPETIA